MNRLELVVFVYLKDGKSKEIIEYLDDTFSEELLIELKEELSTLEYTFKELNSLSLLSEDIQEVSGIIFERSEDNSAEVLEEFSLDFD